MRLGNCGAGLKIRGLVDRVRLCFLNQWLSDRDKWFTRMFVRFLLKVTKGTLWDLDVARDEIYSESRFKFVQHTLEKDVIFPFLKEFIWTNRISVEVCNWLFATPYTWISCGLDHVWRIQNISFFDSWERGLALLLNLMWFSSILRYVFPAYLVILLMPWLLHPLISVHLLISRTYWSIWWWFNSRHPEASSINICLDWRSKFIEHLLRFCLLSIIWINCHHLL